MLGTDWSVPGAKLIENLPLFCYVEDCSGKKDLKISIFWRISVIKLPLWYSGDMMAFFIIHKSF